MFIKGCLQFVHDFGLVGSLALGLGLPLVVFGLGPGNAGSSDGIKPRNGLVRIDWFILKDPHEKCVANEPKGGWSKGGAGSRDGNYQQREQRGEADRIFQSSER